MATTYYFRNIGIASNAYVVGHRPDYTGTGGAQTISAALLASTTAGSGSTTNLNFSAVASATYLAIGATASSATGYGYGYVTPPLNTVTVSGSISIIMYGYESAMTTNGVWGVEIYRLDAAGNYVSTIGTGTVGSEMPYTSASSNTITIGSPTSTTLATGDRIGIRPYVTNTGTMGAGTFYLYHDNTASVTSYVTFTETITEYTGPTGSTVYLTDTASDLGGSGQKQAWTTADAGNTSTTTNTSANPADPGNQITASAGGTALTWFTPTLNAVTVAGRMKVDWYGSESNLAANTYPWIKVERTNGSGTVQSTIYSGALYMEQDSSARDMEWFPLPTSTSISAGDRIKFTLYIASAKGFGNQAASYTATVPYGTATGVNVVFTETLARYGISATVQAAAAGTGTANTSGKTVEPRNLGAGAGTGTAYVATGRPGVQPTAGVGTATGAAYGITAKTTAAAGVAASSGAAYASVTAVKPNALEAAAGTSAALDATAEVTEAGTNFTCQAAATGIATAILVNANLNATAGYARGRSA